MSTKTLNQLLAANLKREMEAKGLSANRLGAKANVSPNTVGNYLSTDPLPTSKGKERSAKLAEVEALAKALGIPALRLLIDPEDAAAITRSVTDAVINAIGEASALPAAPTPSKQGGLRLAHETPTDARDHPVQFNRRPKPARQPGKKDGSNKDH